MPLKPALRTYLTLSNSLPSHHSGQLLPTSSSSTYREPAAHRIPPELLHKMFHDPTLSNKDKLKIALSGKRMMAHTEWFIDIVIDTVVEAERQMIIWQNPNPTLGIQDGHSYLDKMETLKITQEIPFKDTKKILSFLAEKKLRSLRQLSLESTGRSVEEMDPPNEPYDGHFPALERLSLKASPYWVHCGHVWNIIGIASSLREINLTRISEVDVHAILGNLPVLESLIIHTFSVASLAELPPRPLPNVKGIAYKINGDGLPDVFKNIPYHFPNLMQLHLQAEDDDSDSGHLFAEVFPYNSKQPAQASQLKVLQYSSSHSPPSTSYGDLNLIFPRLTILCVHLNWLEFFQPHLSSTLKTVVIWRLRFSMNQRRIDSGRTLDTKELYFEIERFTSGGGLEAVKIF